MRRQVPTRSIAQIIQILEWEGVVEPGQIKRSTLQEKLAERGYSARHMRMYADTGTAAWQAAIKFFPSGHLHKII